MDLGENLFGMTLAQLQQALLPLGAPPYAARQVARWLYRRVVTDPEAMTDLGKDLRRRLKERFPVQVPHPLAVQVSRDGTRKYLFPAAVSPVEAAFIPEEDRATLCLSCQAGCKLGCRFCATGASGWRGDLSPGEILGQYFGLPERERVTNLVFMGMGEPFDNLEAVLTAIDILTADWGLGLSDRRITVSTAGLTPKLAAFLARSRVRLALSLHSPFPEERQRLMPVEKAYPVVEFLRELRHLTRGDNRRLSVEYILFDGVNDTSTHARALARFLAGWSVRVNLIRFHPHPGCDLRPSSESRILAFQAELKRQGIQTNLRKSRGEDIDAACGLLRLRAS